MRFTRHCFLPAKQLTNQLFLHGTSISLSPNPAHLTIGQLTEPLTRSTNSKDQKTIPPEHFKPNPRFIELLHSTLAKEAPNDIAYTLDTHLYHNQAMPIADLRNPPEDHRIPEVEDTFGFVSVGDDGKVIAGSYQANGFYRVVDANGKGIELSEDALKAIRAKLVE